MKTLQNYMDAKRTDLFKRTGAFFAFSDKQLEEGIKPNTKYVSLGNAMFCIKGKEDELIEQLDVIYNDAVQQDIEENGIKAIIRRELYNYESFYTMSTDDARDALVDYKVTAEQIAEVFREEIKNGAFDDL